MNECDGLTFLPFTFVPHGNSFNDVVSDTHHEVSVNLKEGAFLDLSEPTRALRFHDVVSWAICHSSTQMLGFKILQRVSWHVWSLLLLCRVSRLLHYCER